MTWEMLMVLKDVLELDLSLRFTNESLCYLESKQSQHRELLLTAIPDCRLRPKHHYIEHYPHLTKVFGPLIDMWTMRFEGKHKFFKKFIHETQSFKNVPLTLAMRHQKMMAYHFRLCFLFQASAPSKQSQEHNDFLPPREHSRHFVPKNWSTKHIFVGHVCQC